MDFLRPAQKKKIRHTLRKKKGKERGRGKTLFNTPINKKRRFSPDIRKRPASVILGKALEERSGMAAHASQKTLQKGKKGQIF